MSSAVGVGVVVVVVEVHIVTDVKVLHIFEFKIHFQRTVGGAWAGEALANFSLPHE